MKLAAAALAMALACPGCSSTETVGPVPIEFGKDFSLKLGGSAQAADAALRVGFEAVSADSRCARGDRCVWAGAATVRIWWQQAAGPRRSHELRLGPAAGQTLRLGDQELRLLRLDPYPVTGRAVVVSDYVATMTLGPAQAGDPAR